MLVLDGTLQPVEMITVACADELISQHSSMQLSIDSRGLEDALGVSLQDPLYSDRDQPPFDRVMMDGYAVHAEASKQTNPTLDLVSLQLAGEKPQTLARVDQCIEVATGAALPRGSGRVLPYEASRREGKKIFVRQWPSSTYVHWRGSDCRAGDVLLPARTEMHAPQLGLAAAIGACQISGVRPPRIAILSTGDELVSCDSHPGKYQVRASNAVAIRGALKQAGYRHVFLRHVKDQVDSMKSVLDELFAEVDILLSIGCISRGVSDLLPQLFKDFGVTQVFHRVAQRPGRPMWFGSRGSRQVVFGLPGNPNSALICFYRYVIPFLACILGARPRQIYAKLAPGFHSHSHLTRFVLVRVRYTKDGTCLAFPLDASNSGDLVSLALADGFVELAPGISGPKAAPLYEWRL